MVETDLKDKYIGEKNPTSLQNKVSTCGKFIIKKRIRLWLISR